MSTDPRVERALVLYNEVFLSLDEMSCATPKSIAAEATFKTHLAAAFAKCDADYAAMRELVVNGGTEIARLTAELEEARKDAWRPIETAPKDGSDFLGVWGSRVILTHWLDNSKTDTPWAGWRVPSMVALRVGERVTHWTPLPKPPAAAMTAAAPKAPGA